MAAYSIDLRQKILSAWQNKEGTQRELAKRAGVAESRYDKLIVRAQTSENDLFDFDTELEHLQILDSELVIELNILAFFQI